MYKPQVAVNEKKIAELVGKKVAATTRIREARLELSRLNADLLKAGAGINEIAAW